MQLRITQNARYFWGFPGAKKYRIDGFGAKMGPLKELRKAEVSCWVLIITLCIYKLYVAILGS